MPRGPIKYLVLKEGRSKPKLPSLFGRGRRESVLAMVTVAGPLYWHEIQRSAGFAEGHSVRRELGALLDSELLLTNIEPGRRRYVSLNALHPWCRHLRALGRALARIDMPRILVAANAARPAPLEKALVPDRKSVEALFGSTSKTALLLALKERGGGPSDLRDRTGISLVHLHELVRGLQADGIVRHAGGIVFLNRKWSAQHPLRAFLGRLSDVFSANGKVRWSVPVVLGTETRTKLVSLLAANGPSRYKDLCPVLRASPAGVYRAAIQLIRMGVVHTLRDIDGDQKLSFYALDPTHPACAEIKALGCAIAVRDEAPHWREVGNFEPRPFPGRKRNPGGWLFKRNRKTLTLLLVHAAGRIDYNGIATALRVTYKEARFTTAHLLRDGLLVERHQGRHLSVEPNSQNPYNGELAALASRLLRVQYPDLAPLVQALPEVSKPKTLRG